MKRTVLFILAAMALTASTPGGACGPGFYDLWFWHRHAPGPAFDDYLDGDLGILFPFRHPRVPGPLLEVVAYRHLAGLGLTAREQAMLTAFTEPDERSDHDALLAWEEARGQEIPRRETGAVGLYKRLREEDGAAPGAVYYRVIQVCYGDAFDTAVTTLRARREVYDAEALAQWLRGQDRVFLACSEETALPDAARPSWPALLRADRAYQRAATALYLRRYDRALALFRQIAADPGSPWRPIGTYLVARTLYRRAEPGDWQEARSVLEAILADPSLAAAHDAADSLLGFFRARSEPEARRRELAARIAAPRLYIDTQGLIDYGLLLRAAAGDEVEDVSEWIRAFRAGPEGAAPAARRWSQRRSLPWLVLAAMTAADAEAPLVAEILAAIERVPAESPAYPTLAYHAARLEASAGRYPAARARLEELLADGALSLSDRNRAHALLARLAPDLETYLQLVAMRPVLAGWTDGSSRSIPGPDEDAEGRLFLAWDAVSAINRHFPLETVLEAARAAHLPPDLRLPVARTAWVRAFVLGEEEIAVAAAELLIELEEEPRRAGLERYLTASSGADRAFMAALHMLRHSDATPRLRQPIPEFFERRLWCPGPLWYRAAGAGAEPPLFLAGADRGTSSREVESGQRLLGRIVLERARAHPGDERLPEALHLVVRATRKGCPSERQGEVSRAAFELLHARYPQSVWTKKTPYWFD